MRAILGVVLGAGLLLAGCGSEPVATDPEPAPVTTPAPPTTAAPATTPPATPSAPGRVIPDDFPLLSGLPVDDEPANESDGRRGPNRTMEPIVPEACGERVLLPADTDHLRASWSSYEDGRSRQLVAFADAHRAQSYAERVLDLFRACPVETTSPEIDETRHTSVVDSDLGDFAGAASTLYRQHDLPAPGLSTWYVVRVGAAVLLSVSYNEGGAGPDRARDAAEQRQRDAHAIAEVVDAMHTLTGDYPSEPPFGPDGFGQVTLGMSREALLAVPGVRFTGGNGGCEDFEAPGVRGHLQPGLGVAVLFLSSHADLETPEQVHLGSTLAEVRAAYPHGEYDDPWFSQPPYRFELGEGDRVISLMLLLEDQHCGS